MLYCYVFRKPADRLGLSSWSERSELRGVGDLGGGERSRKAVNMGSGDASDAMDAE